MERTPPAPADSSPQATWWSRPAGGREVLIVAAPLVISTLSWTVMNLIDRIFLNWVSGAAMSAAFAAGVLWYAILCLPLGVASYVNTFVAQYDGAGQHRRIGVAVWQSVWVSLGFAPLILATWPVGEYLIDISGHDPLQTKFEKEYLGIMLVGGPGLVIAQALSAFYGGRGQTWVMMIVDSAASFLNVVLDYWWIFGGLGVGAHGLSGAAWATVVAIWAKAAVYLWLFLQPRYEAEFAVHSGCVWDSDLIARFFRFGGPSGLQMLLDVAGFTAFMMILGRLGPLEFESTSLAFGVGSFAFMPVVGVGIAVSILVGQHLGENREALAERATYTGLTLALGYMAVISTLYWFTPDLFLAGFFASQPKIESVAPDAVREQAVLLLRYVAAYNVFDATFIVFVSALKGAGDTRFILLVSMALAAALSTLTYLSVDVWNLGLTACWLLITAWLWIAATTFFLRFRAGYWKKMRVIETASVEVIAGDAAPEPSA